MNKICAALILAGLAAPAFAAPEADVSTAVATQLDRMQREIDGLRAEVQRMKDEKPAPPAGQAGSQAADGNPSSPSSYDSLTASDAKAANSRPATTLSGYGEINYNRPRNAADAQLDVRRAVLGLAHRFTDKTRLNMELEIEHAAHQQ